MAEEGRRWWSGSVWCCNCLPSRPSALKKVEAGAGNKAGPPSFPFQRHPTPTAPTLIKIDEARSGLKQIPPSYTARASHSPLPLQTDALVRCGWPKVTLY